MEKPHGLRSVRLFRCTEGGTLFVRVAAGVGRMVLHRHVPRHRADEPDDEEVPDGGGGEEDAEDHRHAVAGGHRDAERREPEQERRHERAGDVRPFRHRYGAMGVRGDGLPLESELDVRERRPGGELPGDAVDELVQHDAGEEEGEEVPRQQDVRRPLDALQPPHRAEERDLRHGEEAERKGGGLRLEHGDGVVFFLA